MAETAIALTFFLLFVLGLIQLVALASTKHIVNYAAFAGARAAMYGEEGSTEQGREAAEAVTRMMNWGQPAIVEIPPDPPGRIRVRYPTPFAVPLIGMAPGTVVVTGVNLVADQPVIPETGDNARR